MPKQKIRNIFCNDLQSGLPSEQDIDKSSKIKNKYHHHHHPEAHTYTDLIYTLIPSNVRNLRTCCWTIAKIISGQESPPRMNSSSCHPKRSAEEFINYLSSNKTTIKLLYIYHARMKYWKQSKMQLDTFNYPQAGISPIKSFL